MTLPTVLMPCLALLALAAGPADAQAPVGAPPASQPAADISDPPEARRQPGVPVGQVLKFTIEQSKVFPGTTHAVTVYVPDQYRPETPACVYVGFDGLAYNVPTVFDNLIERKEMPVTIAVGIEPGQVASARQPEDPRFDRSAEFDAVDGRLARFVLDEVLPEVEKRKTSDNRKIFLSKDPNDRAVGGTSSGGAAAFTAAWQRPDAFHRVFTAIGTFVAMRGADAYPALIRKSEPKPLRVYLQDGSADTWPGGPEFGDWWLGNQAVEQSLAFAGYDVTHAWGTGGHDGKHANAIFPDAVRWLWRDWPRPITPGLSQNTFLKAILVAGETWTAADAADVPDALTAADANRSFKTHFGDVYAIDADAGKLTYRKPSGQVAVLDGELRHPSAVVLSPDGLWLAVFERESRVGYSYRVRPDGTTDARTRFYWLHAADDADAAPAGAVYDRDGRLYVATRLGVQVMDRNGRCRAILPVGGEALAVAFGGVSRQDLFVKTADGVVRRRLTATGLAPEANTIELPSHTAG